MILHDITASVGKTPMVELARLGRIAWSAGRQTGNAESVCGFETRDRGEDDRSAAGRYRRTVYHLCIIRGGCEYWTRCRPTIYCSRPAASGRRLNSTLGSRAYDVATLT
jgi:hypothetical protein